MAGIHVVWNDEAIALLPVTDSEVRNAMERLAAGCVVTMKVLCPVSPRGPFHESGHLRRSITKVRGADGSYIIGPTASYASYVNNGTLPHLITSHGPWSLHSRESGAYFGRVVHHPGTTGVHFIEKTAGQVGSTIRP